MIRYSRGRGYRPGPPKFIKDCLKKGLDRQTCNLLHCALQMQEHNESGANFTCPSMENDSLSLCSSRYDDDTYEGVSLQFMFWLDGPCTVIAALLALVGAINAVRFLHNAGLNRNLTAALCLLCLVDSLLMVTVVFFYSIEATGRCFFDVNPLARYASDLARLHPVASSLTISSTFLVVYITVQRFMAVVRPLKYANLGERRQRASQKTRKLSSFHESEAAPSLSFAPPYRNISFLARRRLSIRRTFRPFKIPALLTLFAFVVSLPSYFEFATVDCFSYELNSTTTGIVPSAFREWSPYKTLHTFLTQTIFPVAIIFVLTVLTEYKVYYSLRIRRQLFESQQRARSLVLSEELKEKVSRYVSIFIAVKFLLFRTMPITFDVMEGIWGGEIFNANVLLSILIRLADFMVVLNSATNSFVYFGKQRWVEKRLRLRILKKEEKRALKSQAKNGADHTFNNNGNAAKSPDSEKSNGRQRIGLFATNSVDSTSRVLKNERSRLLDGDRVDV